MNDDIFPLADKTFPMIQTPQAAPADTSLRPLDDERLASAFKALAHPARIAILRALADSDRACCGDIVGKLPLAQSTVSQHLQVLRDAGLIRGALEGRRSRYGIDGAMVSELGRVSAVLFADLAAAEDKLAIGLGSLDEESCCDSTAATVEAGR